MESWILAVNAPVVVGLRVMKAHQMAHKSAWWLDPEWARMVNEKVTAASLSQRALLRSPFSLYSPWRWSGQSMKAAQSTIRPYSTRVTRNVSRLSKG